MFPESQKYITELIALVNNCGHSIVLTTHSPYVLGTLNNLLYAKTISPQARKEANKIIRESLWLDYNAFDSWFVKNGTIENCMDADIHMIQNEKIDEISKVINEDFERLLELQTGDRCDYLLMNETSKTAYLIELKGSDLVKAASQLEATENALRSQLVEYQLQYRIVANKCKTQEIHSSAYRKYQIRWKSRLLQKTGYIEEKI